MNCRRIQDLIPLYVGGELDARATDSVMSHLGVCRECSSVAAEFEDSRRWLGSAPLEFDDALLAQMKSGVMREVVTLKARRRPLAWMSESFDWMTPRALVAAAIVLVAILSIALLISSRSNGRQPSDQRATGGHPAAPGNPDNAHQDTIGIIDEGKKHRRRHPARFATREQRVEPAPDVASPDVARNGNPRVPLTPEEFADQTDQMLRIEIQTSDPHVRIIWFAPKESDSQEPKPVTDFE